MYIPDFNVLDKLKPCPFCGGPPIVVENNSYGGCFVECTKCDIGFMDEADNLQNVVEAWQTRKYSDNPFNFLYEFEHWFAFEVAVRNNDD